MSLIPFDLRSIQEPISKTLPYVIHQFFNIWMLNDKMSKDFRKIWNMFIQELNKLEDWWINSKAKISQKITH